jgi:hypothetical protein
LLLLTIAATKQFRYDKLRIACPLRILCPCLR